MSSSQRIVLKLSNPLMLQGKTDTRNIMTLRREEGWKFFIFYKSLVVMFKDFHETKISGARSSCPTRKNRTGRLDSRNRRNISFSFLPNFPHTLAVLHRTSEISFEVTYFERIVSAFSGDTAVSPGNINLHCTFHFCYHKREKSISSPSC